MDTNKCEAFLEAVNSGTILAAAKKLNYTPSGINRMINSLETELGVTLLIRNRKGVVLTEAGASLLPLIRQFLRCNETILENCADLNHILRGTIHIGSYYSVAAHKLPRLIHSFSNLYPNIQLNLVEDGMKNLLDQLKLGNLDCCFLPNPESSNLLFYPLIQDQLTIWLPREHPLAAQDKVSVYELEKYPFISMIPEKNIMIEKLCRKYDLILDIRYTSCDSYTIFRMVEENLGISANNELTSRHWMGDIVTLPLDPPQLIQIGLVTLKSHKNSNILNRFLDYTKQNWP